MITDAQYAAWLRNSQVTRCVLAEVQAYSGGQVVTRYLSNCDYTSEPSDTPANQTYDSVVIDDGTLEFTVELSEAFTGRSKASFGDLKIANVDGELDDWLDDAWDGRAVSLYLGDPSWPRGDFRLILAGTVDDIHAPDRDVLALQIRDKTRLLDVPVQRNLIGGTTANKDEVKPLGIGPVFNAEPRLIDAALHKYQWHDGQVNAMTAVRENGAALGYTADLPTGTFTLTAGAVGRITGDFQGAAPAGYGYLTKCADIVRWLVKTMPPAPLTDADIDAASFAAFNVTCPQTLNDYIRDRTNLIDVLDRLLTSVGGFWYFGRDGKLRLGRLDAPAGAWDLDIMEDDIIEREVEVESREIPLASVRLGYAKNWTVQTDGLAGSVTEANRALYAAPYQIAKATNAGITTAHPLAREPDVEDTRIAGAGDAATEATRRATLRSVIRKSFDLRAFAVPFSIDPGAKVLLKYYRFGFPTGDVGVVVKMAERPLEGRVHLRLWK